MASKIGKILVVDDNQGIRRALEILLPLHFAEVKTIPSPSTLVSTLEQYRPDVVLLDMNFYTNINTGNEGLYWAGEIKKMVPEVEVVLFTAYADIALAVEGMKRGAFDFIVKPWDNDKLIEVLSDIPDYCTVAFRLNQGEEPNGKSKLVKFLRSNAAEIHFTVQDQNMLFRWITRRFAFYGKGVEMEAAALYMNAARCGKRALGMFTISDELYSGKSLPSEERETGFRQMMELALDTAAALDE